MQEEKIIESENELWELVGDRWILPLNVRFEEGHALVKLASIPLLDTQKVVASVELSAFPVNAGEHILTEEQLRHVARKSKFGNPQDVVEWRRMIAPALHFPKNEGVDEFLDAYVAKGVVQSRATISAIYSTLCAHMLSWLLQGKPLPLIFATIYPLLYRKNWREIVHQKFIRKGRKLEEDSLITPIHVVGATEIRSTRMVRVAEWSLNVVHEPMFEKYATQLEDRIRLAKRGQPSKYWKNVRARVRQQIEYAKRCYAEYRKATRQKSLAFLDGGRPGYRGPKKRRKHYRSDGRLYTLDHIPGRRAQGKEPRTAGYFPPSSPQLPEVSGVQPQANDMRDIWKDVSGSKSSVQPDGE